MKTTGEKIKDGTIRIENGKLVGLGTQSIDIAALNELFEYCDKSDVVDSVSDIIYGICRVYSAFSRHHSGEIHEFFESEIVPALPQESELYYLNLLQKALNK